jgi:hypothetical protein
MRITYPKLHFQKAKMPQVGAWLSSIGATWAGAQRHDLRGSARRALQALERWPPASFLSASKALGAEFASGTLLPAASSANIRQHGRVDKDLAVGLGNACAGQA